MNPIIFLFLSFILSLISATGSGQQKTDSLRKERQDSKVIFKTLPISEGFPIQYPLTRDTAGKYPDYIEVDGIITDISPGIACGVLCDCGTFKIRPSKTPSLYPNQDVFVAVACLSSKDNNRLNTSIRIKLKILKKDNNDCFWKAPMNTIDSKGVPFYIPADNTW